MKKLALLLGALSLVSSVAYAKEVVPAVEEVVVVEEVKPVEAAPALRVTSVGQYIEIDNESHATDGDIGEVMFGNSVGLAYGDNWTFGLMARKTWIMDTDNGTHSNNHRIDLDAWRNFENFSVGTRWRSQKDYDRLYGRVKYNYGMFDGWVDVAYQFNNTSEGNDAWYSEAEPIALTVGPLRFAYYYELTKGIESADIANAVKPADFKEDDIVHQLRVSAPIYKGEKLSLGLEYRWQFAHDEEYDDAYKSGWQERTEHIGIVSAAYKVTENLTVDGYYRYDFQDYEGKDGAKDADKDYYGEFYAGWTYTF